MLSLVRTLTPLLKIADKDLHEIIIIATDVAFFHNAVYYLISGNQKPDWRSVWKCSCGAYNYWRVTCSKCSLPKDIEHDFIKECEDEGLMAKRTFGITNI